MKFWPTQSTSTKSNTNLLNQVPSPDHLNLQFLKRKNKFHSKSRSSATWTAAFCTCLFLVRLARTGKPSLGSSLNDLTEPPAQTNLLLGLSSFHVFYWTQV